MLVVDDFWHTASRFNNATQQHGRGRLFCLFSNPIDKILSDFTQYQQHVRSNKGDSITLQQYISNTASNDNSLVRGLVNIKDGRALTKEHLDIAKKIVETKFLVGLEEDPEESLQRFASYFERKRKCTNKTIHKKLRSSKRSKQQQQYSKKDYQMVAKANRLDLELFRFIQATFQKQAAVLST
jgi:hypothetical protein